MDEYNLGGLFLFSSLFFLSLQLCLDRDITSNGPKARQLHFDT